MAMLPLRAVATAFFTMTLCSLTVAPARAGLTSVSLFNSAVYQQTSVSPPTNPSSYYFSLGGSFAAPGDFSLIEVLPDGGVTRTMTITGTTFRHQSSSFNSLTALHNNYPLGNYRYVARRVSPVALEITPLNYAADQFGNVPAFTPAGFTTLKNFNPGTSNTISFNAFIPTPTANDSFTFFSVIDQQADKVVFDASFLSTSVTSVTIPANTLSTGRSYVVYLVFSNRFRGLEQGVNTFMGFDTRNHVFFTPTAVPEPASLGVLAGAVIPLLMRRRQRAGSGLYSSTMRGSTNA